jgi:hypothetical protein
LLLPLHAAVVLGEHLFLHLSFRLRELERVGEDDAAKRDVVAASFPRCAVEPWKVSSMLMAAM